jgi:hypothetical protein
MTNKVETGNVQCVDVYVGGTDRACREGDQAGRGFRLLFLRQDRMKHFPGKVELIVLCTMAALCTLILSMVQARDTGLFFLALPLFLCSAFLGLWKSGGLHADED